MAVTLADRKHSGNDPRRMSLRKIMLSFGAIISATFFRNGGNTPERINTPKSIKIENQTQEDRSSEGQRSAARLRETRQRSNKLITTLLAVKLTAQGRGFLSRSHHQPPPSPLIESFSVSRDLCEQVEWFGVFLVPHYTTPCSTIDPLGQSLSKHILTPIFSIRAMHQAR